MRVMIDASNLHIGGGIQVGLAILNKIIEDDTFDLTCVVSPEIDKQLNDTFRRKIKHYVVEHNVSMLGKYYQAKRISLIEENFKPDLVFVVFGPCYWKPKAISLQGFALGKMIYADELDLSFKEKILHKIKEYFILRSKSFIVVESDVVKRKFIDFFNYDENKVFVVGNSYSSFFHKFVLQNKTKVYKNINKFNILVPGSYYKHKNLERVIRSLTHLNNKNVHLVFTIPVESEGWKNLSRLAKELNVLNLISTVGFVENSRFAKFYLECNAVICASLVESSTAVIPEAFLSRRPLIISDKPFARELCEDAALFFDPYDVNSLANAIDELSLDLELQSTLAARGSVILNKNYPSAETKWLMQKKLILQLVNESI